MCEARYDGEQCRFVPDEKHEHRSVYGRDGGRYYVKWLDDGTVTYDQRIVRVEVAGQTIYEDSSRRRD